MSNTIANLVDSEIHKASFYMAISPYYLVALWKPEWLFYTSVIQGSGLVMFIYMTWVQRQKMKRLIAEIQAANEALGKVFKDIGRWKNKDQ